MHLLLFCGRWDGPKEVPFEGLGTGEAPPHLVPGPGLHDPPLGFCSKQEAIHCVLL